MLPILRAVGADAAKWAELAAYDLATAEAMLGAGRYLYVLFCSQQAVEKSLKAVLVDRTGEFPPRTHDLLRLARAGKIPLTEDRDAFLRTVTKYYIGTRYPEEIRLLANEVSRELAGGILQDAKGIVQWLETLRK